MEEMKSNFPILPPNYIKPSALGPGSGSGFFLGAFEGVIPKGTTIGYYIGKLLYADDADYANNHYYLALDRSATILIDGSDLDLNPCGYIQHQCPSSKRVNAEFRHMKQDSKEAMEVFRRVYDQSEGLFQPILGVARVKSVKRLGPNQELFINYRADYYKHILKGHCLCEYHEKKRHT